MSHGRVRSKMDDAEQRRFSLCRRQAGGLHNYFGERSKSATCGHNQEPKMTEENTESGSTPTTPSEEQVGSTALLAKLVRVLNAYEGGDALVSNQGQAMDGYSALANFKAIAEQARDLLANVKRTRGGEPSSKTSNGAARRRVTRLVVHLISWVRRLFGQKGKSDSSSSTPSVFSNHRVSGVIFQYDWRRWPRG